MDNCRIHKANWIIEMIENRYIFFLSLLLLFDAQGTRGMRVEFLPPYSPDFNPIELVFSALKSYIRRNGEELRQLMRSGGSRAAIMAYLWRLVYSVKPGDAEGYYFHCGYLTRRDVEYPEEV